MIRGVARGGVYIYTPPPKKIFLWGKNDVICGLIVDQYLSTPRNVFIATALIIRASVEFTVAGCEAGQKSRSAFQPPGSRPKHCMM